MGDQVIHALDQVCLCAGLLSRRRIIDNPMACFFTPIGLVKAHAVFGACQPGDGRALKVALGIDHPIGCEVAQLSAHTQPGAQPALSLKVNRTFQGRHGGDQWREFRLDSPGDLGPWVRLVQGMQEAQRAGYIAQVGETYNENAFGIVQ